MASVPIPSYMGIRPDVLEEARGNYSHRRELKGSEWPATLPVEFGKPFKVRQYMPNNDLSPFIIAVVKEYDEPVTDSKTGKPRNKIKMSIHFEKKEGDKDPALGTQYVNGQNTFMTTSMNAEKWDRLLNNQDKMEALFKVAIADLRSGKPLQKFEHYYSLMLKDIRSQQAAKRSISAPALAM